jgi:hypothetical protein
VSKCLSSPSLFIADLSTIKDPEAFVIEDKVLFEWRWRTWFTLIMTEFSGLNFKLIDRIQDQGLIRIQKCRAKMWIKLLLLDLTTSMAGIK